VGWELRNNVEISFNVHTEVFIEFSFLWFTLPFISVDKVPLLVDSSMLVVNNDLSVLVVVVSLYI
jgi:hypothetical protein